MPPSETVILITGTNRGIGRALADIYLSRPNHTLLALVRDPTSESSLSLTTPTTTYGANSHAILVPYDASSTTSAAAALTHLQTAHSTITHIDTLIANAGILSYHGPATSAPSTDYLSAFTINTLGPLTLFTTFLPLLTAASHPKFIALSSAGGSLAFAAAARLALDANGNPRAGAPCYAASKAALNMVVLKIAAENPGVAVGLVTPGPTRTGLGEGRVDFDVVPGVQEVGVVSQGLVGVIDELGNGEGEGGEGMVLRDWKGEVIPW